MRYDCCIKTTAPYSPGGVYSPMQEQHCWHVQGVFWCKLLRLRWRNRGSLSNGASSTWQYHLHGHGIWQEGSSAKLWPVTFLQNSKVQQRHNRPVFTCLCKRGFSFLVSFVSTCKVPLDLRTCWWFHLCFPPILPCVFTMGPFPNLVCTCVLYGYVSFHGCPEVVGAALLFSALCSSKAPYLFAQRKAPARALHHPWTTPHRNVWYYTQQGLAHPCLLSVTLPVCHSFTTWT